jgi:hypothetical protein
MSTTHHDLEVTDVIGIPMSMPDDSKGGEQIWAGTSDKKRVTESDERRVES